MRVVDGKDLRRMGSWHIPLLESNGMGGRKEKKQTWLVQLPSLLLKSHKNL